MQPIAIFPKIKIVPSASCVAHEGVVPRWVDAIATNMRDEGAMKNPIIVTRLRGTAANGPRFVVIDGMHRFAALRTLEIPDVVIYEIDYFATDTTLAGWDALLFRSFSAQTMLEKLFGNAKAYRIERVAALCDAQALIEQRHALLAVTDRKHAPLVVMPRREPTVDLCVRASQLFDAAADAEQLRPLYVADSLSLADYARTKAAGIVLRTHYTKQEIIERTLAGKLFPRKSTRHLIPGRPLRVDVTLAWLRAKISLAAKNRLLQEHLRWCYESDRVRYYPEAVFVFSD